MNVRALVAACDNLKIPYSFIDPNKNVVRIDGARPYFFVNWGTPFNDTGMISIARDKHFAYLVLKDHINMPVTRAYLDPFVSEQYQQYVKMSSIEEIVADIKKHFSVPFVIKKNRGTLGRNVFLVEGEEQIAERVHTILDQDSRHYDYIVLAQERIDIKREWRAVMVGGNIELVYEKDTSKATFKGNLSPLHWENAKAVHVIDDVLIQRLQDFVAPIYKHLPLTWTGLDIAEDTNGELWFIEANTKPGFGNFVRDNGIEPLIPVYEKALRLLQR